MGRKDLLRHKTLTACQRVPIMGRRLLLTATILLTVLVAGCLSPSSVPEPVTESPSQSESERVAENCPLTPHEGQWPRCVDFDDDGMYDEVCMDNVECYCDTPQSADQCQPYVLHRGGEVYGEETNTTATTTHSPSEKALQGGYSVTGSQCETRLRSNPGSAHR